jgi:single-strand DNA-binding protein
MANFNKVMLMGNLTRDIELRHTPGNQAVAKIGLAVNRRFTTGDGEKREETTFIDCEAWGKTAETMSKYLTKGKPVFIEGRLKLDQWEKEGQKFSKLKVVIENFQFIDSGGASRGGGGGDEAGVVQVPNRQPARGTGPTHDWTGQGGRPQMEEDDIPF